MFKNVNFIYDLSVSLSRESLQMSLAPTQVTSADIIQTSDEEFCEAVEELPIKSKRKRKVQHSKSVNKLWYEDVKPVSESSISTEGQATNTETQTKKKVYKIKNISKAIPSIKSQMDVQTLLDDESRKRSLTSSLGDKQWLLLKKLVAKLNSKLKKNHDENKKQQILEQIRKAFKIALS